MTNSSLHKYAMDLVYDCSIPPHLSGFTFLLEAVVMKSENSTIKLIDIYKSIAHNHHSTHRAITRNITYAISQSDGILDFLSISASDLFNGRVIAILALKLRSICSTD